MDDFLALLEHGHLILACRNGGGAERGDVGSLAHRVAEEAERDAGLKVLLLDLGLDGRVALNAGDGDQVHVIEGELGELGNP